MQRGAEVAEAGVVCALWRPAVGRVQQEGSSGNCLRGWVQEACRMGRLWRLNSYLEDSGKMVSFIKNTQTENICVCCQSCGRYQEI